MKLAIMQPYLFPYIGYFQLMNACDHFVVYDDVQFIKSGWINRNRLLSNGQPCYFNFRLKGSSTFDKIQEKMFIDQIDRDKEKFLKSLQGMYGKAPYFAETYQLIRRIIEVDEPRVSCFVAHTLEELAAHFGMDITFHRSSDMDIPADIHGQERVLWINKHLGSAEYINVAGGMELYDKDVFRQHGLELRFLQPQLEPYPQFKNEFVPGLSIIDVMMFNPREKIVEMLGDYQLL